MNPEFFLPAHIHTYDMPAEEAYNLEFGEKRDTEENPVD